MESPSTQTDEIQAAILEPHERSTVCRQQGGILTIEELNNKLKNCDSCGLSQTRTNVICGEGNHQAHLMIVAQAPGEHEDTEGRMFTGPSGELLNSFLKELGVSKNSIYMTNLIKCRLPRNRRPKNVEIESSGRFLEMEIELVKPSVIATMGYYAARFIFRSYGMDFPESKHDVSRIFGKLFHAGPVNLYPMGHTAAILYNSDLKASIENQYSKLYVLSRRCKWFDVCPMKYFSENSMIDSKWIEFYCHGDWESCERYWKEENGEYHPDKMLPDGSLLNEL